MLLITKKDVVLYSIFFVCLFLTEILLGVYIYNRTKSEIQEVYLKEIKSATCKDEVRQILDDPKFCELYGCFKRNIISDHIWKNKNYDLLVENRNLIRKRRSSVCEELESEGCLTKGEPGVPGAPGLQGIAGIPGLNGAAGPVGPSGVNGEKGDSGTPGSPGVPGTAGIAGQKGDAGPVGQAGLNGEKGDSGIPGSPGVSGTPGVSGQKGDVGPVGQPGVNGEKGESGIPGSPGVPGTPGEPGQKGDAGPVGLTGTKGATGDPGSPGLTGTTGAKGDTGIQGSPGLKGDMGLAGIHGEKGEQGLQGPVGYKGDAGAPGLPGLKGDVGLTGVPGERGQQGLSGPTGAPGTPGVVGPPGERGVAGHIGPPGPRGARCDSLFSCTSGGSELGELEKIQLSECSIVNAEYTVHRNTNPTLKLTFTPKQKIEKVKVAAEGIVADVPVPIYIPQPDGCIASGLTCPLQAGQEYTYVFSFPIPKYLPKVAVTLKWQLKNEHDKDIICLLAPGRIK